MPFKGRLLVAHFGDEPKAGLIRYASMVARLCHSPSVDESIWPVDGTLPISGKEYTCVAQSRQAYAQQSSIGQDCDPNASDPEVRFLTLLPPGGIRPAGADSTRSLFREKVNKYFADPADRLSVACDVLRGQSVRRLLAFSRDFESGLILVGDDGSNRPKLSELAREASCPIWTVPSGWAPVLRRILVPIDLTHRSIDGLRTAVQLAQRFPRAKCLALHVDRHDTRLSDDAITPQRRSELQAAFEKVSSGINSSGIPVVPLFVKSQHVEREIQRAADRHSPDLIIMATRGRSRAARKLFPSVTAATLRHCSAAMLVLQSPGQRLGLLAALRSRSNTDDPQFS
jgi:nucleotide-binding universal stress UspA family protein